MSSSKDEEDQKKRSQAIDRVLDEDSKRLRRECKILLLGKRLQQISSGSWDRLVAFACLIRGCSRVRRERQVNNCEADEDHPSQRIL